MEAELIRKSLWGNIEIVIDETGKDADAVKAELQAKLNKRNAQKMAEARAEMILRVDDGQLSHMRSKDPLEVWETLKGVHRARGFATSLALRRKFLTAKKLDGQTMAGWIGSIRSQVFTMEGAGIDVSDQDTILALTMGLPSDYDTVIINFDSTPTDQLTMDNVVARLLNEESRQASITTPAVTPKTVKDEAFAVTTTRAPRLDVTCHFCDKKGHFKSECREKQKWEQWKKGPTGDAAMSVDSAW